MAIITESELDIRLNHVNNAAKGRTPGALNLPDKLREIIGFQAHFETAAEVSKQFGIAPITAHEQKDGRGHIDVKRKIDERLGEVRDLAVEKMLTSLGVISTEKIKAMKPHSALKVAEGMARIISHVGEKQEQNVNQIVIYAPQVRETKYEKVIEVEK